MAKPKAQFIEYEGYKFPPGTSQSEMKQYVDYYGTAAAPRGPAEDVANEEFGGRHMEKPPKGLYPTNERSMGEVTSSLPRSLALRALAMAPTVAAMFAGGAAGGALKSAPWLARTAGAVGGAFGGAAAARGGELGIHSMAGVPLPEDIPADIIYEGLLQGAGPELIGRSMAGVARAYGNRLVAAGSPRPLTMTPSTATHMAERNPNIVQELEKKGLPRGNPKNPAGTQALVSERKAGNTNLGQLIADADATGEKYTLKELADPFIRAREELLKRPLTKKERRQALLDVRDLANELLAEQRAPGAPPTRQVTWSPSEMQDIKLAAQSKNVARYNKPGRNPRLTPKTTEWLASRSRQLLEEIEGVGSQNAELAKLRDMTRVWGQAEFADRFRQANVPIIPPMPGGMPYAAKFGLFQNLLPSMTPGTALTVGRAAMDPALGRNLRMSAYAPIMIRDLLRDPEPEYNPDAYLEDE